MQKFIFLLTLLFSFQLAFTQSEYSKVKILLEGQSIEKIAQLGVDVEHGIHARKKFFINDFSTEEIEAIKESGFEVEVLIEDVISFYAEQKAILTAPARNANCNSEEVNYASPENYEDGSMGGFLTFDELLTTLDKMHDLYPSLITAKSPIGNFQTVDGNSIYWVKVSDNPNVDEGEEEILFTALHHAREPASLSQMVYFLWYLLENHKDDPEIQYIINNTEMYFIPVVNPDGYIFNEMENPQGGGLWRKNRSPSGRGIGVDLNRNYGFEWAYDDTGSSPNPRSDTYRGESAFSEIETQAVKAFCESHEFKIALNYHSFGNLLIHPWGYEDGPTDVDSIFKGLGRVMTEENDYLLGTGVETVGYTVNGDSDDWMFGESFTKPAIFSLTPEIGPDNIGFWPAASGIETINKSALRQNINATRLLLAFIEVKELTVNNLISERSGSLNLNIINQGLINLPVDLNVTSKIENQLVNSIPGNTIALRNQETQELNIDYQLSESVEDGDTITFIVRLDYGSFEETLEIEKVFFDQPLSIIFSENGENLNIWETMGSDWGFSEIEHVSPPTSITDSPGQTHGSNENKTIELLEEIDLSDQERAYLNFWAKWDLEKSFDFVQVSISANGDSYIPLCGLHTNPGSIFQEENQPVYDGKSDWVQEYIDISEFVGQKVNIRFTFRSDMYEERDGFYFDDFKILGLQKNTTSSREETLSNNYFSLYPNPTTDQIQISFLENNDSNIHEVVITNSIGEIVFQEKGIFKHKSIQTTNWAAGMYFVNVYLPQQGSLSKKVTIFK